MNVNTNTYGAVKVTTYKDGSITTSIGHEVADIPAMMAKHAQNQIDTNRKTSEQSWTETHRAVMNLPSSRGRA